MSGTNAGGSPAGEKPRAAAEGNARATGETWTGGSAAKGTAAEGGTTTNAERRARLMAKLLKIGEEETRRLASHVDGRGDAATAEEVRNMLSAVSGNREEVATVMIRLAMLDPRMAMAKAIAGNSGALSEETERVMGAIISEMAKVDAPAAEAAVSELEEEARKAEENVITRLLAARDPAEALAFARTTDNDEAQTLAIQLMGRVDPFAAAAEIIPGKETHRTAVMETASAMRKTDPVAFEAWAGTLADPAQRAAAREAGFAQASEEDPEGAAHAAAAWMTGDPEAAKAAEWFSRALAVAWIEKEGTAARAAAWAATLPEGGMRDEAVSQAGHAWVREDAEAASAWLKTLPESQGRDYVTLELVERINREEPAAAFAWARTVGSESSRMSALWLCTVSWVRRDPEAAAAAVETLTMEDLPAEELGNLRKRLPTMIKTERERK